MGKKKSPIAASSKQPKYPRIIETFGAPYWGGLRSVSAPSCFNGIVEIRKYRVTIEIVDEPKEVYAARLLDLWHHCNNWHHWDPLKAAAKKLGIELPDNERGMKVRKTTST